MGGYLPRGLPHQARGRDHSVFGAAWGRPCSGFGVPGCVKILICHASISFAVCQVATETSASGFSRCGCAGDRGGIAKQVGPSRGPVTVFLLLRPLNTALCYGMRVLGRDLCPGFSLPRQWREIPASSTRHGSCLFRCIGGLFLYHPSHSFRYPDPERRRFGLPADLLPRSQGLLSTTPVAYVHRA